MDVLLFNRLIRNFWIEEQVDLYQERKTKLEYYKLKIEEKFSRLKGHFKIISNSRFVFFGDMDQINQEYAPIVKKIHYDYYKRESNRPSSKIARSLHRTKRQNLKNCSYISIDEKQLMKEFFRECPEGYVIDHIMPLAKGGTHSLDNLQWLPKSINAKKNDKIVIPQTNYPHCRLDIKELF